MAKTNTKLERAISEMASTGAEVRRIGKKFAVAWVRRKDDPDHLAAAKRLEELLKKIVDHVKSGEISSQASKDVTAFMLWSKEEIERSDRRAMEMGFGLAQSVAQIDTDARRRGAMKMRENDPTQAAKAAAIELWPTANQKGWTAERLWTELLNDGHNVRADTVRKWVTRLRKTGTC